MSFSPAAREPGSAANRDAADPRQPPPQRIPISAIALAVLTLPAGAGDVSAATSISQSGITWTFDRDYPAGQFVNGDYWVVGPVAIVDIAPHTETVEGRTINGSMVDPVPASIQGYDSAMYASLGPRFDPQLNVATGVSTESPLVLAAGTSLISTISAPEAGALPQLTDAAILTVVTTPPPEGSFRPPYCGTDRTPRWNVSQLDYTKLRSLPKPEVVRPLEWLQWEFRRPWLEQNPDWTGRYLHPSGNMPSYGRDMSYLVGEAVLMMNLDYTVAEKTPLAVSLVQYGIDIYGVAQAGGVWLNNGGHNQGRKLPLLFAATLLGDEAMLAFGDAARHFIFQEDQQTWRVELADVGRWLYWGDIVPREMYVSEDVGMAEWGVMHWTHPNLDNRSWDTPYRAVVGSCLIGHVLAARLMGLEAAWNWSPLFDYFERYWEKENAKGVGANNQIGPLSHAMWTAYRYATPPAIASGPADQETITGSSVSFDIAASGTEPLMYQWMKDGAPVEGATLRTLTLTAVTEQDAGSYAVVVSNGMGGVTSTAARLVVTTPPAILAGPVDQWVPAGGAATFEVTATGTAPLAYQWSKEGAPLAGATTSALKLDGVTTAEAGRYSVEVSNAAGVATGGPVQLTVATPQRSRLVNTSVRSVTRGNASPLIMGLVVAGSGRTVLIRAIGPSLAPYGVLGYIPNPHVDVHGMIDGVDRIVGSNDDWGTGDREAMRATMASAGAFPLEEASLDAALALSLAGARTVHAADAAGVTGVTLVEAYDLGGETENRIVNVSARNFVGAGEQVLITGFIVSGETPLRLLVRGIGPGLKAFGVTETLSDPRIDLHTTAWNGNEPVDTILAANDDWTRGDIAALRAAFERTGAFPLAEADGRDAAMIVEVPAGVYTVLLTGKNGETGEGLIEVYEIP